jgi:putative acetyltransferase
LKPLPIRHAAGAADLAHARALFEEYAAWIAVDLSFQNFAAELATLPGAYAPPRGRLLLAGPPGAAAGCVALRPAAVAGEPEGTVSEMKRLYVRPEGRGTGTGARLVESLLVEAREIGYRTMVLDTIDWMTDARRLYARFGFAERSPYYHNPFPGVVYMTRTL